MIRLHNIKTPTLLFHFHLDNIQAPVFQIQPSKSSSTVAEGRTKILHCKATGNETFFFKYIQNFFQSLSHANVKTFVTLS